jgi:hypothetical protein
LGRHDPKACQRDTGRAWAEEKIHRAISARPDVPPVLRGHDPKRHEAREGRAVRRGWLVRPLLALHRTSTFCDFFSPVCFVNLPRVFLSQAMVLPPSPPVQWQLSHPPPPPQPPVAGIDLNITPGASSSTTPPRVDLPMGPGVWAEGSSECLRLALSTVRPWALPCQYIPLMNLLIIRHFLSLSFLSLMALTRVCGGTNARFTLRCTLSRRR